jgi:hypothetical protein
MTESKVETPFDKGARILNAVIAEVDLPADLKGNAQSVIRMLAEFLPQLLTPPAAAPASSKPAPPSTTPLDDSLDVEWFSKAVDTALNERPKKTRAERPKPLATAPKTKARPRTPAAADATQPPAAAPADMLEADLQLIWDTYAMVMELQRNQAEHLSEALIAGLGERPNPTRVVQIMTTASLGAARLWRAALVDLSQT